MRIADDLNTHTAKILHYVSGNVVTKNPDGICGWLLFFSPHVTVAKEWLLVMSVRVNHKYVH